MPSIAHYQRDLILANEHIEYCHAHEDRVAITCDLDEQNRKVPVCEACWCERWPVIKARLAAQRLIQGGLL
jgi:hypothetical protein